MNQDLLEHGMTLANWLKFLHLAFQSLLAAAGKVEAHMLIKTIELNTSNYEELGLHIKRREPPQNKSCEVSSDQKVQDCQQVLQAQHLTMLERSAQSESSQTHDEDFLSIGDVIGALQFQEQDAATSERQTLNSPQVDNESANNDSHAAVTNCVQQSVLLEWDQVTQQVLKLFLFPKLLSDTDVEQLQFLREKCIKTLADQSVLLDLSAGVYRPKSTLQMLPLLNDLNTYSQNLRALSLQRQTLSLQSVLTEIEDLKGLAILNLQGVKSCDLEIGQAIRKFRCPSLQFLNISCLQIKDFWFNEGLLGLVEVIAHSNEIKSMRGFQNLRQLRLLDVENNQITDQYYPKTLEVLNSKFNQIAAYVQGINVHNPLTSIKSYSRFEKFGDLAFGEPCQVKQSLRVIKICPSEFPCSSEPSYGTPTDDTQLKKTEQQDNGNGKAGFVKHKLQKELVLCSSAESVLMQAALTELSHLNQNLKSKSEVHQPAQETNKQAGVNNQGRKCPNQPVVNYKQGFQNEARYGKHSVQQYFQHPAGGQQNKQAQHSYTSNPLPNLMNPQAQLHGHTQNILLEKNLNQLKSLKANTDQAVNAMKIQKKPRNTSIHSRQPQSHSQGGTCLQSHRINQKKQEFSDLKPHSQTNLKNRALKVTDRKPSNGTAGKSELNMTPVFSDQNIRHSQNSRSVGTNSKSPLARTQNRQKRFGKSLLMKKRDPAHKPPQFQPLDTLFNKQSQYLPEFNENVPASTQAAAVQQLAQNEVNLQYQQQAHMQQLQAAKSAAHLFGHFQNQPETARVRCPPPPLMTQHQLANQNKQSNNLFWAPKTVQQQSRRQAVSLESDMGIQRKSMVWGSQATGNGLNGGFPFQGPPPIDPKSSSLHINLVNLMRK